MPQPKNTIMGMRMVIMVMITLTTAMITITITRTTIIRTTITTIMATTMITAMTIIMTMATVTTNITVTSTSMTTRRKVAPLRAREEKISDKVSDEAALTPAALYRLTTWLSPAYPVGAFSYSSGIEWAVETGDITNAATLADWLSAMLEQGAGFCDGVLFAHAHRAAHDDSALRGVAELAAALTPSKERHLETTSQGRAFVGITRAAWPCGALDRLMQSWDGPVAYPVAVGVTCAGHDIPLAPSLHLFLQAVAANWVSAGVRLIPLGQTDSQRVMGLLEPIITATAQRALTASLDDIGSATFRADLSSMRHEIQYTRLFRS